MKDKIEKQESKMRKLLGSEAESKKKHLIIVEKQKRIEILTLKMLELQEVADKVQKTSAMNSDLVTRQSTLMS